MMQLAHAEEAIGDRTVRFDFGENWKQYLGGLTEEHIHQAERSLSTSLGLETLHSQTFLDVGSGSGLFSLAARRLGARVHSFDYNPRSVACTAELKERYFACSSDWTIERGSVLDKDYMASLGTFDVVYAWGVLHHTGAMWTGLQNVIDAVANGGSLYTAIYNDQGRMSKVWRQIKRLYNALPAPMHLVVLYPVAARLWGPRLAVDTLHGAPLRTWKSYTATRRGMSPWHDVVDWVGGLPFEVATPEAVFDFCHQRGFTLEHLTTKGGGIGCNEYVFRRR